MLSRAAKHAFYLAAGPAMQVNGWLYKQFRAGKSTEPAKLHLGPGRENYLDGWVNIDANMFTGKCDVWADLRNPLPFSSSSVDAVYSHHVIEHLPDLQAHFDDVFRVLKPGGIYRVGGPNGDSAIQKFVERDHEWFGDWPDKYESIGGRFVNLVFCRNEHLTLLTESYLNEIARRAGFPETEPVLPVRETCDRQVFADCLAKEYESDFEAPHTLLMEFSKK